MDGSPGLGAAKSRNVLGIRSHGGDPTIIMQFCFFICNTICQDCYGRVPGTCQMYLPALNTSYMKASISYIVLVTVCSVFIYFSAEVCQFVLSWWSVSLLCWKKSFHVPSAWTVKYDPGSLKQMLSSKLCLLKAWKRCCSSSFAWSPAQALHEQ